MELEDKGSMSSSNGSFQTGLEEQSENRSENSEIQNRIEKIACLLKCNERDTFADISKKLLELAGNEKSTKQLHLINIIIANMFDATREELGRLRQDFTNIFEMRMAQQLTVDDEAFLHLEILGAGAFGIVTAGKLVIPGRKPKKVAIKKSKEKIYNKLIPYEASILSRLNHENILKIYAINKSATELAIELMELGNLVEAVQKFQFSKVNVLRILKDVASGMEYLSTKKYLHRDLACRNVFVNIRKQCKIGDFSLSVYVGDKDQVYQETENIEFNHNVSPETLITREFRVESDVWAMGILAWEFFYIIEYANQLPPAFITEMFHLQRFRDMDAMLPRPTNCPKNLYLYITDELLNRELEKRPTFSNIKAKLMKMLSEKR